MNQVHKESLEHVENALANRQSLDIEIFGMEGIPEDIVQQHNQRIIQNFYQEQAERHAATGNPPPGAKGGQGPAKKIKIEDEEELKKRLAEHKARRAAQRAAVANGSAGSTLGDGPLPGQAVSGPPCWNGSSRLQSVVLTFIPRPSLVSRNSMASRVSRPPVYPAPHFLRGTHKTLLLPPVVTANIRRRPCQPGHRTTSRRLRAYPSAHRSAAHSILALQAIPHLQSTISWPVRHGKATTLTSSSGWRRRASSRRRRWKRQKS